MSGASPSAAACAERRVPPLDEAAMLASMERRIEALALDMSGLVAATEAATGPYAATAVIAALAGAAEVIAVGRDSARHGTFADAVAAVSSLARRGGVAGRISFCRSLSADALGRTDILTNSGAVRPISRAMIERLPTRAVLAMMYEAWEYRPADFDLAASREQGIRIAAVNERHPAVGVFDFLGPLLVDLLSRHGLEPAGRRIAIVCDNDFAPYLAGGIAAAGGAPAVFAGPEAVPARGWDAVVLALDPVRNPPLAGEALAALAGRAPGAALAQFWGDLDRAAAADLGIAPVLPAEAPAPGHMGVLLSDLGHEPIIRLQAGGLAAAVLTARGLSGGADGIAVPF